jgi:hypothetical protein
MQAIEKLTLWTTAHKRMNRCTLDTMENRQPPPLRRPENMPPILGHEDLRQHWRAVMGPLGFTRRILWLLFIDVHRRATHVLTQVEDLPEMPDIEMLRNIMHVSGGVLASSVVGGSLALQLSRPGRGELLESDRAWARGLTFAAAEAQIALQPIYLATCDDIRIFAPDDLIPTGR